MFLTIQTNGSFETLHRKKLYVKKQKRIGNIIAKEFLLFYKEYLLFYLKTKYFMLRMELLRMPTYFLFVFLFIF